MYRLSVFMKFLNIGQLRRVENQFQEKLLRTSTICSGDYSNEFLVCYKFQVS